MKVLVAGATGAVGSRLTPLLATAGHRVAGLTRSPGKVEALRRAGVEARVVDAFDRNAVRAALREARPEVVVHEMTALQNASDLVHFDRAFATTTRLRTEALDHLIAAAAGRARLAAGLCLLAARLCRGDRVRRVSREFGTSRLAALTPSGLPQRRDQIEEFGQGFQLRKGLATQISRQFGQSSPQFGDLVLERRKKHIAHH